MKLVTHPAQYKPVPGSAIQVPLDHWPDSMRDVAFTLKRQPAQVAQKFNLRFEREHDSLDDYDAALLELPNFGGDGRRHVAFQAYCHSPDKTIRVIPDRPSSMMIHYLVRRLCITEDDIAWASPQVMHQLQREWKRRRRGFPVARGRNRLRSHGAQFPRLARGSHR